MDRRLHVLQHVPFEGPGHIGWWALQNDIKLARTQLYQDQALPELDDVDGLVVLGGPMSVHDQQEHAWLPGERSLIEAAIEAGIPTLGVCLGAQLIAEVLGGTVVEADQPEVGWAPIQTTPAAAEHPVGRHLEDGQEVLHWHAETVELPEGAVHLARSKACKHQAFAYEEHVLGLQFHLEMDQADVQHLGEASPGDLGQDGPYIQTLEEMLSQPDRFEACHATLDDLLDAWFQPIDEENG